MVSLSPHSRCNEDPRALPARRSPRCSPRARCWRCSSALGMRGTGRWRSTSEARTASAQLRGGDGQGARCDRVSAVARPASLTLPSVASGGGVAASARRLRGAGGAPLRCSGAAGRERAAARRQATTPALRTPSATPAPRRRPARAGGHLDAQPGGGRGPRPRRPGARSRQQDARAHASRHHRRAPLLDAGRRAPPRPRSPSSGSRPPSRPSAGETTSGGRRLAHQPQSCGAGAGSCPATQRRRRDPARVVVREAAAPQRG